MNTPTPETDELIRTQSKRVGITPSVMVEKLTFKCEDLEMQRNAALEDLAFRRDLYKLLEKRHNRQLIELTAALDSLRKIENMANNPQDMPWSTLESISITARKILASPDESPTN
jgi:hypothetical protein